MDRTCVVVWVLWLCRSVAVYLTIWLYLVLWLRIGHGRNAYCLVLWLCTSFLMLYLSLRVCVCVGVFACAWMLCILHTYSMLFEPRDTVWEIPMRKERRQSTAALSSHALNVEQSECRLALPTKHATILWACIYVWFTNDPKAGLLTSLPQPSLSLSVSLSHRKSYSAY